MPHIVSLIILLFAYTNSCFAGDEVLYCSFSSFGVNGRASGGMKGGGLQKIIISNNAVLLSYARGGVEEGYTLDAGVYFVKSVEYNVPLSSNYYGGSASLNARKYDFGDGKKIFMVSGDQFPSIDSRTGRKDTVEKVYGTSDIFSVVEYNILFRSEWLCAHLW